MRYSIAQMDWIEEDNVLDEILLEPAGTQAVVGDRVAWLGYAGKLKVSRITKVTPDQIEDDYGCYWNADAFTAPGASRPRIYKRSAMEPQFEDVIDEAKRITSGDRKTSYGTPERNFQRISILWKAWMISRYGTAEQSFAADKALGEAVGLIAANVDPKDVAIMNLLQKLARESHSSKRDNFTDIIGYARCAAEVAGYGPPKK